MQDRARAVIAAVEELVAQLDHADALVADQQARIEMLERQVHLLQALHERGGTAA